MKEYKFLLKPLLFIFNLLFATWLVIAIEQLRPSDMGRFQKYFETPKEVPLGSDKDLLRSLIISYGQGQLDSIKLEKKMEEVIRRIRQK